MNAERLLAHFEQISEAPDAIARLRRFILDLAVRGKLVEQDPEDEPAEAWLNILSVHKGKESRSSRSRLSHSDKTNPSNLPNGWCHAFFGEVALIRSNLVNPGNHPDKPHIAPDSIESWTARLLPFQTIAESGVTSPKHLFQPGVILYSKIRPNLAKAIKVDFDGLCSADMYPIEPLLDRDYLLKYMISTSFVEQATAGDNRVAMPKINQAALNQIVVPVPPLAEQHRIVAKVDELMALCDQLEAARQQREQTRERLVAASLQRLNQPAEDPASFRQHAQFALQTLPSLTTTPAQIKQLRQCILNLAVRGKLVQQDPEDEPAQELLTAVALEKMMQRPNQGGKSIKPMTVESDEINLFPVRMGWVWTTLEEYALDVSTGPFGSMLHQSDYISDGVPVVNPSHMIGGRIHPDPKVTVPSAIADKLATYKLRAGDVVMARRGEVGRAAHVSSEEEGWLCGTGSFIVRFIPEIPREYVLLFLSAGLAREYLLDSAVGSTMTNLNHGILKHMPIPLPPLAEQHRIVAKVDSLMALCDQLEQQLSQADQQRQRLLESLLAEALAKPEEALASVESS
ncbi:restriction endonuclease subunit S [Cyanobium sp. FGCU-6]|nr:restriction endonuclease subunit S [Cyanobium sp. FGCU6]